MQNTTKMWENDHFLNYYISHQYILIVHLASYLFNQMTEPVSPLVGRLHE